MLLKIQSENARKTIAILSVLISMLAIVFMDILPGLESDRLIFLHICLLQIFASVLLYIGSHKANQWFFLPWLLIAFLFAYMLVYKSLFVMSELLKNFKLASMVLMLIYITAGAWFYFVHVVYVDFQEMRCKSQLFIQ